MVVTSGIGYVQESLFLLADGLPMVLVDGVSGTCSWFGGEGTWA